MFVAESKEKAVSSGGATQCAAPPEFSEKGWDVLLQTFRSYAAKTGSRLNLRAACPRLTDEEPVQDVYLYAPPLRYSSQLYRARTEDSVSSRHPKLLRRSPFEHPTKHSRISRTPFPSTRSSNATRVIDAKANLSI
jgi:hypothetical protein